ncbi:MAG: ABC transporter permease, partial [Longimicrobiales bacterium]
YILPNATGPLLVALSFGIPAAIIAESGLALLGLGVQPPTPSWGTMIAAGQLNLLSAWWVTTFAGLAIVFTVLAFNLVGDGLRDAMDPRLRG